jgi:hypothetical protein
MKNIFLTAFVMVIGFTALSSATPVEAATESTVQCAPDAAFCAIAPIPGLTDNITPNADGVALFLNNLYLFCIAIAVTLAIIMIIWGGLEYATQDSPFGKSDGKSKIYNALWGLVLVLAPFVVFTIINPAILNLKAAIPPLKTTWGTTPATTPPVTNPNPKDGEIKPGSACYKKTDGQYFCIATMADCEAFRERNGDSAGSCSQY